MCKNIDIDWIFEGVHKLDSRVKYAFFEGKIVPMAEAKISIDDPWIYVCHVNF